MIHKMGLFSEPFDLVKEGGKLVEVRLNDEKRRKIKVGHIIEFSQLPEKSEVIQVEVTKLTEYPSFYSLYKSIPFPELGCKGWTMEEMVIGTYEIYSRAQEKEYGALAIEIKLVNYSVALSV